jgi:hypothetical protein
MFELIQVVERTAFFRRTTAPVLDPFGDGWWLQSYNRALLRGSRAAIRSGLSPKVRCLIEFDMPRQNSLVDETNLVPGRADLPPGAYLYLFARRADSNQWQQTCKFGEVADEGYAFEIAAVATNQRGHRRILRWFDECSRSGYWAPMNLPAPVAGTRVATIRVLRGKANGK